MQQTKPNSVQMRGLREQKETVGGLLQTCVNQEDKGRSLNVNDLFMIATKILTEQDVKCIDE